jgi:hypothetical protein
MAILSKVAVLQCSFRKTVVERACEHLLQMAQVCHHFGRVDVDRITPAIPVWSG